MWLFSPAVSSPFQAWLAVWPTCDACNKSLGAILFKHPDMHRHPFELARMAGNSDYLPQSLQQSSPAWGRRSRFEIGGKKLMVSEVFLEAFTPWHAALAVHRTQRGKVSAAFRSPTQ